VEVGSPEQLQHRAVGGLALGHRRENAGGGEVVARVERAPAALELFVGGLGHEAPPFTTTPTYVVGGAADRWAGRAGSPAAGLGVRSRCLSVRSGDGYHRRDRHRCRDAGGSMRAEEIAAGRARWQRRYDAARKRDADFTTLSGARVDPVYGPPEGVDYPGFERIGWPGEFPFTRGLYPTGYRGRTWTIRQFSGFGNARQTNQRYRMLLAAGGGGVSVAFDMPTLMGRDTDDPRSAGEIGHCGVAIDSAADMDILFEGIDLGSITTSMTISGPSVPIFCMYLVAAERQGAGIARLDGTLQAVIFKEYIAQKEWLFPPEPHLRLIGDLMEFTTREIPRYKPLSVSGYHIREAGSTAAQELAFTLADGFAYVELGQSRGLDVNAFAPGLSCYFDSHIDFFEEIAKFRAARRIWARWLREVYGATDERALWLRFHTQTAGVSLTAQQPYNNVVRTA